MNVLENKIRQKSSDTKLWVEQIRHIFLDIDECTDRNCCGSMANVQVYQLNAPGKSHQAVTTNCVNIPGSYICNCKKGYWDPTQWANKNSHCNNDRRCKGL